ncbi:sugar transferase [Ornithinimicrobium sp. W1679]|uniref:sugar transferase n=1 Tax=Ornithinimicrobium sp. W1679 TaxID=3418770 RepID=UPI003CEF8A92
MSYRGKRALDVAVAAPALLVTAPLQLATAAVIRLLMGRPIIFCQRRAGIHGHPFTLIKFRTMRNSEGAVDPRTDAQRLTALGKVLRATSLDELPTLWNVLRGDMSLVGPRPLLLEYVPRYSAHEARRLEVRPGVTGLSQVNGRNELPWSDRFLMDVRYVDGASLKWDLKILVLTLWKVFRRDGISSSGHVTMPVFHGSSSERKYPPG